MKSEREKVQGYYYRMDKRTHIVSDPIYGYVLRKFNPKSGHHFDTNFYYTKEDGTEGHYYVHGDPERVKDTSVDCIWLKEKDDAKAYKIFYDFYKTTYFKRINPMLAVLNDIKINAKVFANTEVDA